MSKKIIALVLAALMSVSVFAACNKDGNTSSGNNSNSDYNNDTPLVVGYSAFSQKFSPFFATTAYDQDVAGMTQVSLLTTDRVGGIIYNSIKGETVNYNGTDYTYTGISDIKVEKGEKETVYTINIRDDVKFSDGHVMNADDIIFNYYVELDNAYTGAATLNSIDIVGLKNYRKNDSAAESITITADQVKAEVENPSDELKKLISENIIAPTLTAELDWAEGAWQDYAESMGVKSGLEFYILCYNMDENANFEGKDADTVVAEIIAQYGSDYKALATGYAGDETYYDADVASMAEEMLLDAALKTAGGKEVNSIEGIKKLSDTSVSVTVRGFDAAAIYQICGITVAPLHYYGDEAQYDYEAGKFGFPRGDLSIVESKTTHPMGAGPYVFEKYDNKTVYFKANENYFKGCPKIKNVQFKESDDKDKIPGVAQGVTDVSDPSGSVEAFKSIKSYNSNGELSGDKITTNTVANLGYGYIGINAGTINVGGSIDSEASKNLRKGLATILSVYRDVAISSYYSEVAEIINYPISTTSWAAPQKSDSTYQIAFSKDVNGEDIFKSGMSEDEKYAAALEATKGYLIAAGYTFDEAAGKFTAAPDGAKLKYEVIVPGDGNGDHPNFAIVTNAKEALSKIGITLEINDPADQNILWDKLDANTQELWCAAWGATIDPDMYQVYHSSNYGAGSQSNHYCIKDDELDKLIVDARSSSDQDFRKSTYKTCLDIVMDWAVEIPVYQRQNCIIFSSERVNLDTVTPDITTFYGWMSEIENMEMK